MHRHLVPLLTTAAAIALPVASANAAVAITLAKPGVCSVDQGKELGTQPVAYTLTGLAPGQTGNVTLSGQGLTGTPVPFAAPADGSGTAAGNATWTDTFGTLAPIGDVAATLTATDSTGAVIATAPAVVGNAGIKIGNGKVQKLSKKVDWEVSGLAPLTGQTTYYAFFFKAKEAKKKNLKPFDSMKLGTGTGACGYLKTKRPLTPFKTTGTFVVAVQTSKKFDPKGLGLIGAVKTARVKK